MVFPFKKVIVAQDEVALLFENGIFKRALFPGKYNILLFGGFTVNHLKTKEPFPYVDEIKIYTKDPVLADALEIVDVADHALALHFQDGLLKAALEPGRHVFWKLHHEHQFQHIDVRNPEIDDAFDRSFFSRMALRGHFVHHNVKSYQRGLLFFNHKFVRELGPGQYYFWLGPTQVTLEVADMRRKMLDMTGQEILTADKVPIRVNFACQYRLTQPYRALVEVAKVEDQLYVQLQLILREYVGGFNLDDILAKKEEIAAFVLDRLKHKQDDFGVEFLDAGVKDFILPGDVKDTLSQVLKAEKKALANTITRREETASTRSLLNTAKLMETNPTLMRLKEMEYLERICQKIDRITLHGGKSTMAQLSELLAKSSSSDEA